MKKLFTLLMMVFVTISSYASLTFACGAGARDYNTTKTYYITGSSVINTCITSTQKFQVGSNDTLIIGAGFTRNVSDFGMNTGGVVIIYGTVNLSGNMENNGSTVIVKNGGKISGSGNQNIVNNGTIIVDAGGEIVAGNGSGNITVNGTGPLIVNGTVSGNNVTNYGQIEGYGEMNFSGSYTGGGTINGQSPPFTSPVTLATTGSNIKSWDGSTWSPSAPVSGERVVLNGNFTTSVNGSLNDVAGISVSSGFSLTLDNTDQLSQAEFISNNGTLVIVDDAIVNNGFSIDGFGFTGSGTATLIRNFTRTGWFHMSWPLATSTAQTLGDLTTTGFSFDYTTPVPNVPGSTNIYYWDAATAGWLVPTAGSTIGGKPYNFYATNGNSVSLTGIDMSDLNTTDLSQTLTFGIGGAAPGNSDPAEAGWVNTDVDGWNMVLNPFTAYLDVDELNLPTEVSGGISVWDGLQYLTRNGGTGAAEFLSPNQAFFVRCTAAGSLTTPVSAAVIVPASSYFKTNSDVILNLSGEGHSVNTYITEQPNTTTDFDDQFDATYMRGIAPIFNTVGADSTVYSINQMPSLGGEELYASFYHNSNGKNFTIALDANSASVVNHIYLTDLHTGTVKDLITGDYNFTSNTAAPAQRFKLFFTNSSIGIAEVEANENLKVWFADNTLKLDENIKLENANVQIFSINGQLIATGKADEEIFVNEAGVFVINITTNNNRNYNVKVVKM